MLRERNSHRGPRRGTRLTPARPPRRDWCPTDTGQGNEERESYHHLLSHTRPPPEEWRRKDRTSPSSRVGQGPLFYRDFRVSQRLQGYHWGQETLGDPSSKHYTLQVGERTLPRLSGKGYRSPRATDTDGIRTPPPLRTRPRTEVGPKRDDKDTSTTNLLLGKEQGPSGKGSGGGSGTFRGRRATDVSDARLGVVRSWGRNSVRAEVSTHYCHRGGTGLPHRRTVLPSGPRNLVRDPYVGSYPDVKGRHPPRTRSVCGTEVGQRWDPSPSLPRTSPGLKDGIGRCTWVCFPESPRGPTCATQLRKRRLAKRGVTVLERRSPEAKKEPRPW